MPTQLVPLKLAASAAFAATAPSATNAPFIDDITRSRSERRFTIGTSSWVDQRLDELAPTLAHWGLGDADPVQIKTVNQLRNLLALAAHSGEFQGFIVPGNDGSLQAEWHLNDVSVGLLVEDSGQCSCWIMSRETEAHFEEFGSTSITILKSAAVSYRLNV